MARPKQRIGVDKESRSIKRVKTGSGEPDNTRTSSHEAFGDEPSAETSQSGGLPADTWSKDAMLNGEEVNKDLNAETMQPIPQQEEDCVVLQSTVDGSKTEYLSAKATNTGSVQCPDDGQVESAPAPKDINFTDGKRASDSAAEAQGFDCTTCGNKFHSTSDIKGHPNLGVGICRKCWNFLFSSPYTKSKVDGYEEQCRWCGEGGDIVMCDDCDKVFCKLCIVRNFGPKVLNEIVHSAHWSCFNCNPELLRAHVNEFKKFQASTPSGDSFPVWRRGGSSRNTRNATNSDLRKGYDEGATIAELLAQEEERRRQNPGEWMKPKRTPGRKPSGAPRVSGSRKKTGTSPNITSIPKQTGRARVRHPTAVSRQSSKSNLTIAEMIQKIPTPSVPPAKIYIRPHQWQEKRQQAAEIRRKRAEDQAAKAELLKNAANPPNDSQKNNHENNTTMQAQAAGSNLPHFHCNKDKEVQHLHHHQEDTEKLIMNDNDKVQVKSEYVLDPDAAVSIERKVEIKTIFYSEESTGDLMQTSEDAFGTTAKNLFANFTGVSSGEHHT
ncbi:hypothetical protein KC19_7G075000 [Ceratodon purpureus]|uniref:PHD-type domain-containing protein n=1 Tax=Ceratodon purpureus TaxID=3225 RepID=A0A8T0H7B5_CERPU|nr:hypothetical protein KC19_7G075000 [Ceratodon purpureus]